MALDIETVVHFLKYHLIQHLLPASISFQTFGRVFGFWVCMDKSETPDLGGVIIATPSCLFKEGSTGVQVFSCKQRNRSLHIYIYTYALSISTPNKVTAV